MEIGAYTSGGECVRVGEYGRGCGAGCHDEITSVVGRVRLWWASRGRKSERRMGCIDSCIPQL
jgi:hypothetical protein